MCKRERRKRKRKLKVAGALLSLAGVGVFSIYMVTVALAAPENPGIAELAKKAGLGKKAEAALEEQGAGDSAGQSEAGASAAPDGAGGAEASPGQNGAGVPSGQDGIGASAAPDGAGRAEASPGQDGAGAPAYPKRAGVPLVVVDPGHGGIDEGCSYNGVLEKDINLQIALALQKKLEELGYQVLMTRSDDTYMAKEERARLANLSQADAFISIHQNVCEDTGAEGVEIWYDGTDGSRDCKRLAQLIHKYVLQRTNAKGRELKGEAQFAVTSQTEMPACLIETGFLSNAKERGLLLTPEYQEDLAAGIADAVRLYFEPKTMYLTFDDGPSAKNTETVLDILKERNIKATFFVVGENVRRYPEVAKRIAAEGHTIGIHCDSHDYNVIYASTDSYLEDFEKAYQTVLEVTGVEAKLFRFPGGSVNAYNKNVRKEIVEEMTERGFIYYDWNASLEDAVKKSTPEQLIENAVGSTLGRKRVVMLAHDVVDNTALCLNELLDQFPEYQMKPLSEWNEPIQFPMP